jgi:hypothetical protein
MEYFGTDTTTHGHYMWKITDDHLYDRSLNFKDIPFNPELMPKRKKGDARIKGEVGFYQEGDYSVLAIEGSCVDNRWGTCSVFFIKGELTRDEMVGLLQSIPIAKKIIDQMPFEVQL